MASANLGGEWNPIPVEGDRASLQTTPGQRLCIRARHVSADGNVSEWDFITHDVEGKTVEDSQPADILVAGAQGQISVRHLPPPIEDFDHIQIAIGTVEDPTVATLAYEGRERAWVSERAYRTDTAYYVFLRAVDTSRNPSPWTDPIRVSPSSLTDSEATVRAAFSRPPAATLGDPGDLFVLASSGTVWAKTRSAGWWDTRINAHLAGSATYHLANAARIVPLGALPFTGLLGIPIGPEIAPGSAVVGDDGRVWNWIVSLQRFELSTDITLDDAGPDSALDWTVNRPPTGCGRVFFISTGPPLPIADFLEGIEGLDRPGYDVCVAQDGTIYDNINGSWLARAVRLKPFEQPATIRFRDDTPDRWHWLDHVPVPPAGAFAYGERWDIVVCLNQGADAGNVGYYGRTYIRNKATQIWEDLIPLCDENVPVPAPPRNLAVSTQDTVERIRVTLAWDRPASRTPPSRYRYRLFRKGPFDSDGRRESLMQGVTTFLSVSEIHEVDPPERYYLEVRAEYEGGNSNWARIESLIGLSCATDPPPLAPNMYFTRRFGDQNPLPEVDYNGIPGASVTLGAGGVSVTYAGSGTIPNFYSWYSGGTQGGTTGTNPPGFPEDPDGFRPYLTPAPATATDITSYDIDRYRSFGTDDLPGLVHVAQVRAVSQCGVSYRWGPLVTKDLLNRFAPSVSPRSARQTTIPSDITPPGTPAGTHHFQYRTGEVYGDGIALWTQIVIRGWVLDEFGRAQDIRNIQGLTITEGGRRASAVTFNPRASALRGTTGYEIRVNTGTTSTDRTLVVSGIPTEFDGWYSIGIRTRLKDGTQEDEYSGWNAIRFQERGTTRPRPPATINIVRDLIGNESAATTTSWEFQWEAPIVNLLLNHIPADTYHWRITGSTRRAGEALETRLSVPQLNTGPHTLYVRGVSGSVLGVERSFPFFVRLGDPIPVIRPPENFRDIPSGIAGTAIIQFDRPRTGNVTPTSYPYRVTPTDPAVTGSANATSAGGTARIAGLARGTYTLHIKSRGVDPRPNMGFIESEEVEWMFTVTGEVPLQPFPPRNVFIQEGAARSTWESSWTRPPENPQPTGYETRISGNTTQPAKATSATFETHPNLNAGAHILYVRSVRVTSQGTYYSNEVPYPFIVRAEGCNPVTSLETGTGGTRDMPVWNSQNAFWAAPVGGMAVTGYLWELLDSSGARLQNGTTPVGTRRVSLFNLAEGVYSISVRANCADGPSEARAAGFTIVCPSPEPPERLRPSKTGLQTAEIWTLYWVAPTSGAAVLSYAWTLEGAENRSGTATASAISEVFTGLPRGLYRFSIKSQGDCEKESTSVSVGFEVGGRGRCNPPRLLQKRVGSIWSTWTVNWLPPVEGDTPVRYDWRLTGATNQSGTVDPRADLAGQATMDNLRPGTHTFFVKTVCSLNPLSESGETSIGITVVRGAPGRPLNVEVVGTEAALIFDDDEGTVNCPQRPSPVGTWDPPANPPAPSNYDWELHLAANYPNPMPQSSGSTASGTRRVPLGRIAANSYVFRVRGRSGGLSGPWSADAFVIEPETLDPPVMGTPTGTASSGIGFEDWRAPFTAPPCGLRPQSYAWRLREDGQDEDARTGTRTTAGTIALNTLPLDKTYTLYVKSIHGQRESTEATAAIETGVAGRIFPPENLEARNLPRPGEGNFRFTWDPPSRGIPPSLYRWRHTDPSGTVDTGTTIPITRRVDFTGEAGGTHKLEARSESGSLHSAYVSIDHVLGSAVNPPRNLAVDEVTTEIFGTFSRNFQATWDAPAPSVPPHTITAYRWRYTGASSGSGQITDVSNRKVDMGDLPVGNYTFYVLAVAGNLTSVEVSYAFTVTEIGVNPPEDLRVRGKGSGLVGGRQPLLTWEAEWQPPLPGGRTPTGYTWRLTGPTPSNGTATLANRRPQLGVLQPGSYVFYVRADAGSRRSIEVFKAFTVERPPPTAINPPRELDVSEVVVYAFGEYSRTFQATWDAPAPAVPAQVVTAYQWRYTGASSGSGQITDVANRKVDMGDLPAGNYTFYVLAVTAGGNSTEISEDFTVRPLPVNPPENLRVRGSSSGIVGQRQSGFTWEAEWDPPLPGGRGATGYAWRLTGPSPNSGTTGITASDRRPRLGILSPGTYTFYVKTLSNANESIEIFKSFVVRRAVTINSPRNLRVSETETTALTGGARRNFIANWDPPLTPPGHPAITGYRWRYTGVSSDSGTVPASTRMVDMGDDLGEGDYIFYLLATTSQGDSDEISTTFTVSPQGIEPPVDLQESHEESGGSYTWTFTWRAPLSGRPPRRYTWRLVKKADENSPDDTEVRNGAVPAGTYEAEVTGLEDGAYTFYVKSVSGTHESDEISVDFQQPPEEQLNPPVSVLVKPGSDSAWATARATWQKPTEGPEPDNYKWSWRGPQNSTDMGDGLITQVDLTNLEPGEYEFAVRAAKGTLRDSEPATATFVITRPNPNPPVDPTCEAGGSRTEKTVSWTAPSPGATPATGYKWRAGNQSGDTTSTSVSLTLATGTHTVYVRSTNGDLESEEVSVDCEVEAAPVPPPKNLRATESTTNRFNWSMSWDAPEAGADTPALTGFEWELTHSGMKRTGTTTQVVTTVTFNGLAIDEYAFQVRTVAGQETSDWISIDFEIPEDPLNAPDSVSVNTEGAQTPRDVTATIAPPSEGKTPTGYKWRLTGTKTVQATEISETTFTIPQLAEGSYTVYVRSVAGDAESTDEASAEFDIGPGVNLPSKPQGLSHSLNIDGTHVTYSWAEPEEGLPITGYRWRQTGGMQKQGQFPAGTTSHQESDLTVGTTYTFAVLAYNAAGDGPEATVTFTAERTPQPPGPPLSVEADFTRLSDGVFQVNAFWSEPDEGDPPTHYLASIDGGTHDQPTRTTQRRATFTGVMAGERTVSVVAVNDAGSSSAAEGTVNVAEQGAPNKVTNLLASAVLDEGSLSGQFRHNIITTWTAPMEDATHAAAVRYKAVFMAGPGTDPQTENVTGTRATFLFTDQLRFEITDTTVTVTPIDAMDREGEPETVNVTAPWRPTLGRPGPVRNLRAIYRAGTMTITWLPPITSASNGAAESYVYGTQGIFGRETTSLDIVIFNVVDGQTVEVAVQAKNRFGTGPPVTRTFIAQTAPERP